MAKYILNLEEAMVGNFEPGRIKAYADEYFDGDKTASMLYLWLFNNFSTNSKEVTEDCGRPMYRKLAKTLTKLIEELKDVEKD